MKNKVIVSPPKRYKDSGVLIAFLDGEEMGQDAKDKVLKRIYASARFTKNLRWELLISCECETVNIVDGEDKGYIHERVIKFKWTFPFNAHIRKDMIRLALEDDSLFQS